MARHSLGHRRLRESGNGTSTPQVLTRPKRSYRHVGLRPSTALACSVIAIVQVAALLPAHAQTIWTGNTSSNWFTGGNWQGGAAPTLATNAFLDTIVPNPTVVNGPGAQALDLVVGASFTGALTIGSGGTVANTDGSLGFSSGSMGTVTVSGSGATWTNSGDLYIGRNGTGVLSVGSGGTVSNVVGRVGGCENCSTSAVGTVTVSGAGATWTNSAGLAIGASGTGQVTIAESGKVLTGPSGGFLGVLPGATGTMMVTDPGSTWNISDQLTVGGSGSGMLIVQNGGTVTNTAGTIGSSSGSTGAVSVTGTGSTWTSSGNVTVGLAGTGTLTVAGGGAVNVGGGTGTIVAVPLRATRRSRLAHSMRQPCSSVPARARSTSTTRHRATFLRQR